MSARSPRGSLSGASSAEVADDFGESLKDLQVNNRWEISNLTVIAKEMTEHAQAISKTLENHIKMTPPSRKLPALYLLDSIVKNVGTPYTVYLGRNLYSTFMEAYTLVDGNTRRAMEGMLKTWKDPVPGSMDPRPVFAIETVKPIENALLKAKTAALQTRQMPAQVQPQPDYRNTPTPPNYHNRFVAPPSQTQPQPYYNQQQPSPHPQSGQLNFPATLGQPHVYQHPSSHARPVNEVEDIKRDVGALVAQRQAQFGANPFDQRLRDELKALLDLQKYLNDKTYIDPGSLQQIRERVSGLAISDHGDPRRTPQPNTPQWQPPASTSQTLSPFAAPSSNYAQPSAGQTQPPAALFAPGALDGLQALLANGQKPSTPQMRAVAPPLQNASHSQLQNVQHQAATVPAFDGADLIASLTRNGLLPQTQAAHQPTPPVSNPAIPSAQSTAALLQSLQSILPQVSSQTGTPTLPHAQPAKPNNTTHIPPTSASLKIFRPELVSALYDAQPNQCSTCGRRFPGTEAGREKKARHLDWHFRTNQRIADPSISRGAHRDWFPSELAWVQMKEFDVSTTTAEEAAALTAAAASGGGSGAGTSPAKKANLSPREMFVRAPPGVTRNTCSICFEEMKSAYSEELQDWVFRNAEVWEGKIVHATCLAEMRKSGGSGGSGGMGASSGSLGAALASVAAQGRQRSATPDSSLGKRKAEGSLGGAVGARVRME